MPELAQSEKLAVDPQQSPAKRPQCLPVLGAVDYHRFLPPRVYAPHHFSGLELQADQRRVRFVSSVEAVQIAVLVDRRIEMRGKIVRPPSDAVAAIRQN